MMSRPLILSIELTSHGSHPLPTTSSLPHRPPTRRSARQLPNLPPSSTGKGANSMTAITALTGRSRNHTPVPRPALPAAAS
jgi:hypothetical protein